MPMKPGKDESQSEFMHRCVPEMMGDGKREQEQAVAICLQIWRDKDKKSIDPADYDDRDEFMSDCVAETDDEDACQIAWEERAARGPMRKSGGKNVLFKTHAETVNGMEFILSDETPDRMGDIIASDGWELTNFKRNPVALFNHNPSFIVGRWHNLRIDRGALRGHLELAPEGTSARIDEIRKLVDAGILKAVSVGFVPLQSGPRSKSGTEEKATFGIVGEHYSKVELVETSLVAVPANPAALAVAKSLDVSPSTLQMVFAESGKKDTRLKRKGFTGESAETSRKGKGEAMSLAQRITDLEARITASRDKLTEHLKTVDDTNVSDSQMQTTHDLNELIARDVKLRDSYVESEKSLAKSSEGNGGGGGTGVVARSQNGGGERSDELRMPFGIPKTKDGRIEILARSGCIQLLSHMRKVSIDAAAGMMVKAGYRSYGDEATRMLADWSQRAASAPAMTTVTGWAAELVQQINSDVMETLMPKSVYPRLSNLGLSLSFGRSGRIAIPTRSRTPTIAGSFVGEGAPIPVRQGAFTAQILTPKKMAVISTWTREMDEHSIPAIEPLIRQAIQEDTAVSLDSVLIDTNAATAIRPPGLLNGVTGLTPTAGGGFNALVADLKALTGAVLANTAGFVRAPCFLMNPQQVLSISLTTTTAGTFPFKEEVGNGQLLTYPIIDSGTIPLGTVIFVDAADFVSVGGEAPRFEVSDQATLHMEDTTPLAIGTVGTPAVVAAPTRSLFQTDSIALRLILPMNWALRRTGIVSFVAGVTW